MSIKPKNWPSIKAKIGKWIKKSGAIDVILFGSFARENSSPGDIDLCILINDASEKGAIDIVDSLSKEINLPKSHVTHITEKDFILGSSMSKTLLSEGASISKNAPLASLLGFKPFSIFVYSLKGFSGSKRVRFHYLLQGRKKEKGILGEIKGRIIGKGVIEVPTAKEDLLKEVFESWGISFKIKRVLMES